MTLKSYGLSDIGKKRTNNEDSFLMREQLFCVADGMGGYSFGEKASKMATALLASLYEISETTLTQGNVAETLLDWVKEINGQIYRENQKESSHMGTTIALSLFLNDKLFLANVGDSRIYRISPKIGIEQITDDHSLVAEQVRLGLITEEEARNHPRRNIITRALGIFPDVNVDTFTCTPQAEDFFLLCSDGLCSLVNNDKIAEIILMPEIDLKAKARDLIAAANEAGGNDNITIILIEVQNA
ncbi:MAG: Stp1/IreP family PP2C-type Ser/Thr phosphatase [Candidatus Wallbacteria bacterium]|nr:Stp1/IreP family PP2C-type Ser/Thr phosphatase [Candidatus Wallbacteria bacterium]